MREINPTGLDDYKPAEIARLVETAGIAKARLPVTRLVVLAVLAGAFIALGAAVYTIAMMGTEPGFGPTRILGGLAFSVGLILVIIAGAELFTGNALMVIALVDHKITLPELTRSWIIVYFGNFAGAVSVVIAFWLTGLLDSAAGTTAIAIAEAKAQLTWLEAFTRGILGNILVCLAVWLALAARTVTGKILAILWPITAFVAMGLEHSIADMYLIPQGMLAGADVSTQQFANTLFWVSFGNIVGGAGGVALAYRLAWGPPP